MEEEKQGSRLMSVQQESKHSQPEQVCLLGSGFVIPGAQSATVQEYGYITSSRYSLQCWLLNSELQGSVEISLAGLPDNSLVKLQW